MEKENNSLKVIGQFIAALIYTPIYTCALYYAVVLVMGWMISLPWWAILLLVVFGATVLLKFINMFALMPFFWISKDNKTASFTAGTLALFFIGYNIYNIWKACLGHGNMAIFFAVLVTLVFLYSLLYLFIALFSSIDD